jgi:hypothetical protein
MNLRDAFFRRFGTGAFSGVTLLGWWRILRDNRFSVDVAYWPRAVFITLAAVPNSLVAWLEQHCFGPAIEGAEVQPPVFVLGSWRSGTTYLHNLLAVDDRFAYPNFYQVTYPSTFLLTEKRSAWLIDLCIPKRRPQDAVKLGVNEPQEEDFAICSLCGQCALLTMAFPRNVAFYERFMTLNDLSSSELARWKACYVFFLKKLSLKYDRPLVLKTPPNMARIKTLLDMFPDARFVHIHRNPYDVFRSARHTLFTAGPWWQMQRTKYDDQEAVNDQLIRQGKILYDTYFAQRSLIPSGRLHDVAFEDLERDPMGQVERAYHVLGMPEFHYVKPQLVAYVESLTGYRKNTLPELTGELRERVYRAWRSCFDEWGYPA